MPVKHKPTDALRRVVYDLAKVGTTHKDIAKAVGITDKTLRIHYREELDCAVIVTNGRVGAVLYEKCMAGDTPALIWWTKARMKWNQDIVVTAAEGKSLVPEVSAETVARKMLLLMAKGAAERQELEDLSEDDTLVNEEPGS